MTRSPPGELEKENPDSLAGEIGVEGIEALPRRVSRYGKAKKGAIDVLEYIDGMPELCRRYPRLHMATKALRSCGYYLIFRHYFTVDQVRLHGASLCRRHLLCPLCAIRRGSKALGAYLERWKVIQAEKPLLRPFMVTLTVKDGPDLMERFKHLQKAQRELWKRRHRKRGSVLDLVEGAVWSYEFKRGSGSGQWHPHLHMIALAENKPNAFQLSSEWKAITGDSQIVDVVAIDQDRPASGFLEVFKYAVKFSEQAPADTVHCFLTLGGKRLLGSAGCFHGVVVPDSLLDDPEGLGELPFFTLFYHYLVGGYSLEGKKPF